MTATVTTSHRPALALAGVLSLTLAGCTSSNAGTPAGHSVGSSPQAAGHAAPIRSRTLISTQWGAGAADWSYYDVQNGGSRVGPAVFAYPAGNVLYGTDPAHLKLRAYDDQTGKERVSDEAPITTSSLEGAA